MSIIKNEPVTGSTRKDLIDGLYPLSGLQQGMLFHGLYDEKAGAYFEQFSCDLIEVNTQVFTKSWDYIIQSHSILRSAFYYDKFKVPVQCVFKEVKLPVQVLDYSSRTKEEQAEAIELFKQSEIEEGFDFEVAPLMRLALIRLSDERYHMHWTYHHIILDGWSMPILLEEFLNIYERLLAGEKVEQKEPDNYEDYIRYIERRDKNLEASYWTNYLKDFESGTLLPFIKKTAERTKGLGKYNSLFLNASVEMSAQIRSYAQKNRITVNTLMQGTWSFLLQTYSGKNDVVFGTIVSGRPEDLPGVEQRVGMYINTLPLYTHVNKNDKIDEWLKGLQEEQVMMRQHQHTPLSNIIEWSKVQGELFDSVLVVENYPVSKIIGTKKWSLQVENVATNEHNNYPLSLVVGGSDLITIRFSYNTMLLQKVYIEKIRDHFENVLKEIVEKENGRLSDINFLTPAEVDELLEVFNNRTTSYPENKSIVDLFEEQAVKSPTDIALVFEEQSLSYQELNDRSNQLANYLKKKDLKNEMIPISIERSSEMMIGILGILKAGCTYVPIDPGYPQDRINFMLKDIGVKIIISSSNAAEGLPNLEGKEIIKLDTSWETISHESKDNLCLNINPDNLAYVIYTSGSTGKPKGVLVTHKNIVSLVKEADYVSFNDQNILLSTGSSSFDATTFEYWGMLLNGGQLILCDEAMLLDSDLLKNEIENREVNIMWFTSSWFNQLVETDISLFEKLKTILVGGEKLSLQHIEKLRQTYPSIEIINGYGPTENTTFSLTYNIQEIPENTSIPIGRPLSNRTAFILDEDQRLVPVGVAGEIYLGGSGVAKGYLNQENLTAEKFIKNPFSKEDNSRLYKTGDLGKWLPDGNIEYLGRMDSQVKIRGYRIELEEIEAVLLQSTLVNQAVVLAKEDGLGEKRLIAYVVAQNEFKREEIISYLDNKLPEYMVPTFLVEIDHIPLTANGKVDKKALPDPEKDKSAQQLRAPRTETEKKLTEIWLQILDLDEVDIHDDFFELGGHSLLAIRLMSMIRKQMKLEVTIGDIFDFPTIERLAKHLSNHSSGPLLPKIEVAVRTEYIPLSFSQERLWFIDQLEGSLQYHISALFRLKGNLNVDALSKSLQTIINRHEVLRTVFRKKESNAYQYIQGKDLWELELVDDKIYKENNDKLRDHIQQLIAKPFDLSKDHMFRATLIEVQDAEYLLLVTMHHIASDGWSMPIIVKEIASLYNSYDKGLPVELSPLNIQYADYSIWQRDYLQGEVLDKKINYWKTKLNGVAALNLPTDFQRPSIHSTRGEIRGFNISKELTDKLNSLSRDEGATLFMVLFAAFKILLQRYSGQEDICVGIPIANRAQEEVNNLIGFFVNTLALRSNVNADVPFKEFLQQVKATTMEAYEHQDVPFEKVVEAVVKERDLSRSPLFEVLFALQNTPDLPQLKLGNLSLSAENYQYTTAKFDLSVSINENPHGLRVSVNYSTDLYKEETIERMVAHFEELLISIVKSPREKIANLKMLSQAEEHKLLVDFNDNDHDYPKSKTLVDLFEEQVSKTPKNVAIVFEDVELTYSELNKKANQLAFYLNNKKVEEETLVPVCMERGVEMIVSILGILKAGGAYVPIDPEYPKERITFMLQDIGASIILTSEMCREKLPNAPKLEVIEVDKNWSEISEEKNDNPRANITPANLAYIIYTSGSTGKPKGVMIEHAGVVNLCLGHVEVLGLKPKMATLQFASFGFDASCIEIFNTFLSGGILVLPKKEDLLSASRFEMIINKNQVELAILPPSFQLGIKNAFGTIKTLVSAGEPLNEEITKYFQLKGVKVINAYGPTENTVCSSFTDNPIKDNHRVAIGKPIANTQVYILGKTGALQPAGVPGEICLAGVQVARGYLNLLELTQEKFVIDPFSKEANARMYRSGDLGRWLPDGNIEYLGRLDDQVKIRGFRIELGEIESVLEQIDFVSQAIVLAKEDEGGGKRLVGYVNSGDKEFNPEEVISWLKTKLPEYMVPTSWIKVEKFPVTPNGKIDRKALPDPSVTELIKSEYLSPRNEMEERLARIWQELLGVQRIGVYDNFFELGGHSLMAMRLLTAIHKELGIEVLVIKDLFQFSTIDELGKYLEIKLDMDPQEQDSAEFELIEL